MTHGNVGRERLWGTPSDTLGQYEHDYRFSARCVKCGRSRAISIGHLISSLGASTRLDSAGAQLRCPKCHSVGAELKVNYQGR